MLDVKLQNCTSLRSMAVLSSRAQGRRIHEKFAPAQVAPAPISSRFLCPRPPLSLSSPNQNRHATQAKIVHEWNGHLEIFSRPQVIENFLLRTDIS